MRLSTLQVMIEREIIDVEKTHDVFIEGLSFPESEMYQQGDGHWCETIYAKVMVNGEVKDYELEWDTEDEEITSVMKGAPEIDNDDHLLSTRLEDIDITVRTLNICKINSIETLGDLTKLTRADFLRMRSAGGKKAITELDDLLEKHGLKWKE